MILTTQNSKAGFLSEKISAQHPAFAGHFPQDSLLPGVVLLDMLIQRVQAHYAVSAASAVSAVSAKFAQDRFCLESVKFLSSVRPNDEVSFQWEEQGSKLRFHIYCQTILVAQGSLTSFLQQQASDDHD
jgi:3-hydroxyacyl-[acyl-carrier-protein] dehydratase